MKQRKLSAGEVSSNKQMLASLWIWHLAAQVLLGLTEISQRGSNQWGANFKLKALVWDNDSLTFFSGPFVPPFTSLGCEQQEVTSCSSSHRKPPHTGIPRARCELTCWKPLQQFHRATIPDLSDKALLSPQNPLPHTFLYWNRKTHLGWQVYELLATAQRTPCPSPGLKF